MISETEKNLLQEIAGIHEVPMGAYSLRINGALYGKNDSEHIIIAKRPISPELIFISSPGRRTRASISRC